MAWYYQLKKPLFNPADWVFRVVWPFLYLFILISAYLSYAAEIDDRTHLIIAFVFAVNMFANFMWPYVFFKRRALTQSLFLCGFICATAQILVALLWPVNQLAARLLIPYVVWTAFASWLSFKMWQLNK